MTAQHLASLAVETWLASGTRTAERLNALVTSYTESYYGSAALWPAAIRDLCVSARTMALESQSAYRYRVDC